MVITGAEVPGCRDAPNVHTIGSELLQVHGAAAVTLTRLSEAGRASVIVMFG